MPSPSTTAPTRVTVPSGLSDGRPGGSPTRIGRHEDPDVTRSLSRENDGAALLAAQGYRVHQNPSSEAVASARAATGDRGSPRSAPDYLLEGRVFDHYAPDPSARPRNIHSNAVRKAADGQTQRVVVDLRDWTGDEEALVRQFRDWSSEPLREAKAITRDGRILQPPMRDQQKAD